MGAFYIHRDGVLVQIGSCPDGMEELQAREGCELGIGVPPEHIRFPDPPAPGYGFKRKQEYPPAGEFLDAWVKGDDQAMERYREACLAVKAKYPKPQIG